MDMENIISEEEEGLITLTDENGVETQFEYLDCVEYQGKEYLVLSEPDSEEVVILEVEPVDEENENYIGVEDEALLNAVFAIFQERYEALEDEE